MATVSQASEAPMNAPATLRSTRSQNTAAKASIPRAPSTAPAASSAAASRPRRLPSRPAFRLRRSSCFSIKVALAQKRREREKETSDRGSVTTTDQSREHGGGAAQAETYQVFVPPPFLQRRERDLDREPHACPPAIAHRPKAAPNQTTIETIVAGNARIPARMRSWQTRML